MQIPNLLLLGCLGEDGVVCDDDGYGEYDGKYYDDGDAGEGDGEDNDEEAPLHRCTISSCRQG